MFSALQCVAVCYIPVYILMYAPFSSTAGVCESTSTIFKTLTAAQTRKCTCCSVVVAVRMLQCGCCSIDVAVWLFQCVFLRYLQPTHWSTQSQHTLQHTLQHTHAGAHCSVMLLQWPFRCCSGRCVVVVVLQLLQWSFRCCSACSVTLGPLLHCCCTVSCSAAS